MLRAGQGDRTSVDEGAVQGGNSRARAKIAGMARLMMIRNCIVRKVDSLELWRVCDRVEVPMPILEERRICLPCVLLQDVTLCNFP